MMNTISKLSKINEKQNNQGPLRFNSSLPINIEVLKSLNMDRYKLLLGSREFTTRSQKKLEEGTKYWGSFGENKDGIITISNLEKKPTFFQNDENFLDIECSEFLEEFIKLENPLLDFKESILTNLAKDDISKKDFKIFSNILLALKEGVIHLPFKQNSRANLLQFKKTQSSFEFYCGFENLGPIHGFINNKVLSIEVFFEKTYYFLSKEIEEFDIVADISINKQITPLYAADKLILDLKG